MKSRFCFIDVLLWGFAVYLALHVPLIEMRIEEVEPAALKTAQTPAPAAPPSTEAPEPEQKRGKCFHMPASRCPTNSSCVLVDPVSVLCCHVDSNRLKEGLQLFIHQNTTNLHILNATIDELNVSAAMFRRLASMAITDGSIGKIVGQFPKYSSISCLNISNNNLTSGKLEPSSQRAFAYLFSLTTLDASANNLTEFPLSLVQSNRKISVDFSGNDYLPCKNFQKAMETNNSSLVTFINYDNTRCALDLTFNWFQDVQIVKIDYLREQKELNDSCRSIKDLPANSSCTCVPERLELMGGLSNVVVAVDCSARNLTRLPTNLPANTVKLNVSYNNITSLSAVGDDPSYEHVRQLLADHNDVTAIADLEGTKFIDNFMLFSITHNKLRTIHTYVLSNKFDNANSYTTFQIAGNYIHCDCNTEKVLKVCNTHRDWTDYIYYIISLEVLVLVLLISKVSYDYWVFKTAGYLPWPANKMPRLPCDWLCE